MDLVRFGFGINNLGEIAGTGQDGGLQPPPPIRLPRCLQSLWFFSSFCVMRRVPVFLYTVPTGWFAADSCHLAAGPTSGCNLSIKLQINDSEQIAAIVRPTNGADIVRVALSTRTNTFFIPLPPGVLSVTRPSLNNLGQVVGQIDVAPGGWIWDATNGTRLLQGLVPPVWTILSADGINDQGQIVARASNSSTGFSGPVILDAEVVNTPDRPTGLTAVCNSASQVTVELAIRAKRHFLLLAHQ